jgi:hypothetical protein
VTVLKGRIALFVVPALLSMTGLYFLFSGSVVIITSGDVSHVSFETYKNTRNLHNVGPIYFGIPDSEGNVVTQCAGAGKNLTAYVTPGIFALQKVEC